MTTEAPVESAAKTQLREYVDRGAALLDRHMPGWAQKLDADSLHMADCSRCVLGQVYGNYYLGMARLEGVERWCRFYGFELGFDVILNFDLRVDESWLILGELWVEKAKERVG